MKSRIVILAMLSVQLALTLVAQQSTNDFFPLSVGNKWTYKYVTFDFEAPGDVWTQDSGIAVYTIVSHSTGNDSTIWSFKEVRNIVHHISAPFTFVDTAFAINDSSVFTITEYQSGNHKLLSSIYVAYPWQSVFYLNSTFADSNAFFRYHPSVSQDTFTFAHKSYFGTQSTEILNITYQQSLGLAAVSFSALGFAGWRPSTHHSLTNAVLTSIGPIGTQVVPGQFTVAQSFPNPFNPLTRIPFEISQDAKVTIQIYDLLGRLISTILDETVGVGSHIVVWDASDVPSGTYFCVARTLGQTKSIKLTLVK